MARSRDLSKVLSSSTALATDTELSAYLSLASASTIYQTQASNGLTLIHSSSFSNTNDNAINNVFTSSFRNYKIIMSFNKSSANGVVTAGIRFRSGGSQNSTTNYFYNRASTWNSAFRGAAGEYGATSINFGEIYYTGAPCLFVGDITAPMINNYATEISGVLSTMDAGIPITGDFYGRFLTNNSFDGISLISSATLQGTIRIYGYKD